MPEKISNQPAISNQGQISITLAIRSDGAFMMIFDKQIQELALTPIEAAEVKRALDAYFERKVI